MISVIIPTHKSPEALDLCLRSAIQGQVEENQIIVVVDGFYDITIYIYTCSLYIYMVMYTYIYTCIW